MKIKNLGATSGSPPSTYFLRVTLDTEKDACKLSDQYLERNFWDDTKGVPSLTFL
jgi:hypothetical protein